MKYEKSLREVLQWKEEVGDILYNLTVQDRLKVIREGEKIRLLQNKNVIIPTAESGKNLSLRRTGRRGRIFIEKGLPKPPRR